MPTTIIPPTGPPQIWSWCSTGALNQPAGNALDLLRGRIAGIECTLLGQYFLECLQAQSRFFVDAGAVVGLAAGVGVGLGAAEPAPGSVASEKYQYPPVDPATPEPAPIRVVTTQVCHINSPSLDQRSRATLKPSCAVLASAAIGSLDAERA